MAQQCSEGYVLDTNTVFYFSFGWRPLEDSDEDPESKPRLVDQAEQIIQEAIIVMPFLSKKLKVSGLQPDVLALTSNKVPRLGVC